MFSINYFLLLRMCSLNNLLWNHKHLTEVRIWSWNPDSLLPYTLMNSKYVLPSFNGICHFSQPNLCLPFPWPLVQWCSQVFPSFLSPHISLSFTTASRPLLSSSFPSSLPPHVSYLGNKIESVSLPSSHPLQIYPPPYCHTAGVVFPTLNWLLTPAQASEYIPNFSMCRWPLPPFQDPQQKPQDPFSLMVYRSLLQASQFACLQPLSMLFFMPGIPFTTLLLCSFSYFKDNPLWKLSILFGFKDLLSFSLIAFCDFLYHSINHPIW